MGGQATRFAASPAGRDHNQKGTTEMTEPTEDEALAMDVGHSLNMLAELPRYVDDKDIPVGLRAAAIESFFVHANLLIEFMDEVSLGVPQPGELHERLQETARFARGHVLHTEVDPSAPPVMRVGEADLRARADDVFTAMAELSEFEAVLGEAKSRVATST